MTVLHLPEPISFIVQVLYGDISHFKTLTAWLERCQAALPGWKELCVDPNDIYRAALDSLMSS
jgi:hypothetical protein